MISGTGGGMDLPNGLDASGRKQKVISYQFYVVIKYISYNSDTKALFGQRLAYNG